MFYHKKPVIIEAVLFDGSLSSLQEVLELSGEEKIKIATNEYLMIDTLEGQMKASKGDYIIRGVEGEIYPCKPDIFIQTYELIT